MFLHVSCERCDGARDGPAAEGGLLPHAAYLTEVLNKNKRYIFLIYKNIFQNLDTNTDSTLSPPAPAGRPGPPRPARTAITCLLSKLGIVC